MKKYFFVYLQNCKLVLDFTHLCKKVVSLENQTYILHAWIYQIDFTNFFIITCKISSNETEFRKNNSIFREINLVQWYYNYAGLLECWKLKQIRMYLIYQQLFCYSDFIDFIDFNFGSFQKVKNCHFDHFSSSKF